MFGCEHYKRRCLFIAPCCGQRYACHVCHDESESHEVDRTAVNQVVCAVCDAVQGINKSCEECQVLFGKYFCEKCRLYDYEDKGQYHCDGCGICRVGGNENFFHCDVCGCCLAISLKDNHQCRKNASRRKCPICDKYMHSSRTELAVPPCLHLVHRECYNKRVEEEGRYTCPTCSSNAMNMIEPKYGAILCRDCHKWNEAWFHMGPTRCPDCGSSRTCWSDLSEDVDGASGVSDSQLTSLEGGPGSHGDVDGSLGHEYMSHGEVDGSHSTGTRPRRAPRYTQ